MEALSQARQWHQQALTLAAGVAGPGWLELVHHSLSDCEAYQHWLILNRLAEAVAQPR